MRDDERFDALFRNRPGPRLRQCSFEDLALPVMLGRTNRCTNVAHFSVLDPMTMMARDLCSNHLGECLRQEHMPGKELGLVLL